MLIHKYIQCEIVILSPESEDFISGSDVHKEIITIINSINIFYRRYRHINSELAKHNFNYYCDYNPRIIDRIINYYNILCKNGKVGKKIVYIEALIFKYFFDEEYELYIKQNNALYAFLLDLDFDNNDKALPKGIKYEKNQKDIRYRYWLIYCIFEKNRESLIENEIFDIKYQINSKDIDDALKDIR